MQVPIAFIQLYYITLEHIFSNTTNMNGIQIQHNTCCDSIIIK